MTYLFPNKGITALFQQGGYFFLTVMVIDFVSRLSATKSMIINSIILHTSFRMVCWGPPAGGQFRRVSRGGTSSVVAAYTGLSHFFKAIEAKIAIQTLGRLSTKSNISIIIFTSIIHRAIRRSAHHPKGGVAYVEIVIFAHQASARCKYDNYHHKEITALP